MVRVRQAAREARAQLLDAPDPKPPRKTSRGGGGASRVAFWPACQGESCVGSCEKAVIGEGEGPQLYLRTVALTVSADDGITCEEDLPLHHKGEELRRARMEHNFQRRAAQRDANLARLGDLRREPRCKHRQEGGSQHAEV